VETQDQTYLMSFYSSGFLENKNIIDDDLQAPGGFVNNHWRESNDGIHTTSGDLMLTITSKADKHTGKLFMNKFDNIFFFLLFHE